VAVVVTVAKGYDLGYVRKNQAQKDGAGQTVGGYYINAAQTGEPPGRWWGPGAQALGFAAGQVVEREPYDAVYQQRDPVTRERLGRARGGYLKFSDHLARLRAADLGPGDQVHGVQRAGLGPPSAAASATRRHWLTARRHQLAAAPAGALTGPSKRVIW
jgi:TrwC relaxase